MLSLSQSNDGSLTFHNQHNWVTASGDTINLQTANATGTLSMWRAVNTAKGGVILPDEGTVCFGKK